MRRQPVKRGGEPCLGATTTISSALAVDRRANVPREDGRLLGCHCIGSGATELIHVGHAVLGLGGGLDYFLKTVFNYPTLAECYKVAAYNAANKLALVRHATGSAVPPSVVDADDLVRTIDA